MLGFPNILLPLLLFAHLGLPAVPAVGSEGG